MEKEKHMSNPNDRPDNQALALKIELEEMSATAGDAARENPGQACAKDSEPCDPEREKVHGGACACEQYVSARPLRSVMLAAFIGWLSGRFWKRR